MQTESYLSPVVTVLLPVYGRPQYLSSAIDSVLNQTDPDFHLLIADDGSDSDTKRLISSYRHDHRVHIHFRSHNIGLFANLNSSINLITSPWYLLLCSDDCLHPHAIEYLKHLISTSPGSDLILSSYNTIDNYGLPQYEANAAFYDLFSPVNTIFPPTTLIPHLLHYGSINGNITGMLINKGLMQTAGPWREDWSQAADWEWLIRASERTSVLVSRHPIASVRVHNQQLSVSNRKSQAEIYEVLQVLRILLMHPVLQHYNRRYQWAAHHAQFQLYNIIKKCAFVSIVSTVRHLIYIHNTVGLRLTFISLISSIPSRICNYRSKHPLLPKP